MAACALPPGTINFFSSIFLLLVTFAESRSGQALQPLSRIVSYSIFTTPVSTQKKSGFL